MVPSDPSASVKFELEVVDDDGTVIAPAETNAHVPTEEEIAQNVLLRKLYKLQVARRLMKLETRRAENNRALKSRVAKRRKKNKLEKASRKKNR